MLTKISPTARRDSDMERVSSNLRIGKRLGSRLQVEKSMPNQEKSMRRQSPLEIRRKVDLAAGRLIPTPLQRSLCLLEIEAGVL
jgi:hypothetical protein